MIRSLLLFVHITGVLTMFAGLALEAFGVESAGRATPRASGIVSVRVRAAFGLAVVFLMIAKPDAVVSLVVFGLALGVSTLVALPIGLKRPSALTAGAAVSSVDVDAKSD